MSHHVLIIGSGASGLMAAERLAGQNHSVTVIEARDRTGGRIHSLKTGFSLPLEAGAEFIHGDQPVTMSLVQKSGSERLLLSGNRYHLQNGKLSQGGFFGDQWNQLMEALRKLESDTDMASFLNLNFKQDQYKDLYERVKAFVEGYDAADLNKVSAWALREEWEETDEEHHYHIHGGYSKILQYLEERVKNAGGRIILSAPVAEIQWSAGKVKVLTRDGKDFQGDRLIITVPLGVLQRGTIRFSPPLIAHQEAFHHIGFGGVIKFLFEFKHAFWEEAIKRPLKDTAFVFSDAEIPTWWSQLPDRTPLLTGWLGGPSTFTLDRNALFEKAMASLQYIFSCPAAVIREEVSGWHMADWVKDPYACGAYAYPTVDTNKAREFLSQPVKDTLYFAGEALYNGPAMGTVEAALVSGEKVASKITD